MQNPEISVIIPIYNVEKYLRECLNSVVNQTFRELEILCINDGSTDGSPAILEEFATNDERVRVIHQENQGQAAARNRGLAEARGEFVLFLDSDDFWDLDLCEKVLKKAESSSGDLIQFQFQSFGETSFPFEPEPVDCRTLVSPEEKIRMDHIVPSVWAYAYRRSFLEVHGLRFPERFDFEDVPFIYLARFFANQIDFLSQKLYHYRLGSGYSTSRKSEEKFLRLPAAYNRMIQDLKTACASPEVLRIVTLRKLNEVYFAWTVKKSIHRDFARQIRDDLLPEERALIADPKELPVKKRLFYRAVAGGAFQRLIYGFRFRLFCAWDWFVERLYYRSSLFPEHSEESAWLRSVIKSLEETLARQEDL